tara:strand:- start:164 stop:682 length:519 start_codon:yes stop_codon:yes gene_type:complete
VDSPTYILIFTKAAVLLVAYLLSIGLGVLIHELGHAAMALLLTKQTVSLRVGNSETAKKIRFGRLELTLSLRGFRYGSTSYDRSQESLSTQIIVALSGPLGSLLAIVFAFIFVSTVSREGVLWLLLLSFFVANFRILLVALWPIKYRPNKESDEVWLSDGLDIWRMLRQNKG